MTSLPSSLPVSRVPHPAAAPPLRWGILGTGGIAHHFTEALQRYTRQSVVAVGSRSAQRAARFAAEFGIERSHDSYEALVDDPAVQVVYVATPHSEHRANALLAIAADRHVLVEKAFTRNAFEAAEIVTAARSRNVALMEGMWTRFLPQTDVIRRLLEDGALGDVNTVLADHGQHFPFDPQHRLYAPALAGGALLDLGVYPISFARFVLGRPDHVDAVGELAATGVDAQASVVLRAGTAHAVVNTTLAARTPTTAAIAGTAGLLTLSGPFYAPATLTVEVDGGRRRLVRPPDDITGHLGLCHEAAHLAEVVAAGATESPLLPLEESVEIMATLDAIRAAIGSVLPGERI